MGFVIHIINIELFLHAMFIFCDLYVLPCISYKVYSLAEKVIFKSLMRLSYQSQKNQNKTIHPLYNFSNEYNRCLTYVAGLQRLSPLLTNTYICVALHPCNAQNRNANYIRW
jgi:hypothetical protein